MGRVVVTGGAGFIGANLVRHLATIRAGDRIVVLDDLSTGTRENLDGLDIEVAVGSILDPRSSTSTSTSTSIWSGR